MDAQEFIDQQLSSAFTMRRDLTRQKDQIFSLAQNVENIYRECDQLLTESREFQQYSTFEGNNSLTRSQDLSSSMENPFHFKIYNHLRESDLWMKSVLQAIDDLKTTQQQVVDTICNFKEEQRLSCNGCSETSSNNPLDSIRNVCVDLSNLLLEIRGVLVRACSHTRCFDQFLNPNENNYVHPETVTKNAIEMINNQIISLIQNCFIIEKQPPQVMKTNIRFAACVSLLTGNSFLENEKISVHAYLMNEQEAKRFLANPTPIRMKRPANVKTSTANEIVNNVEYFNEDPHNGTTSASFRNMQVRKIKRCEKKHGSATESVTDEKFAILFTCCMRILDISDEIFCWALSLPVVVCVHGNQEARAWATITWDNAFALQSRKSFQVPEYVPWYQVARALNVKFKGSVGIDLGSDDLYFLACKALRRSLEIDMLNDHRSLISWNAFAKDDLPDCNFSFWDWFYALLKVSREPLKVFFHQGHSIIKFISRQRATELLSSCSPGTFLIRFSDSEPGAVTIAWIGINQQGENEIFMLQPFSAKDFAIRSLADRIGDLNHLIYLYPNIPKDRVFSRHYTRDKDCKGKGYVKPVLALTIVDNMATNHTFHDECTSTTPLVLAHEEFAQEKPQIASSVNWNVFTGEYPQCSSESSSLSSGPDNTPAEYTNTAWSGDQSNNLFQYDLFPQ